MAAADDVGTTAAAPARNVAGTTTRDEIDTRRRCPDVRGAAATAVTSTAAATAAHRATASRLEYATTSAPTSAHDRSPGYLFRLSSSRSITATVSHAATALPCSSSQCTASSHHRRYTDSSSADGPQQCPSSTSDSDHQPAGATDLFTFNLLSSLGASNRQIKCATDSRYRSWQCTPIRGRLQSITT